MFTRSRSLALAIATTALVAIPATASASIVTNGDFETGNFSGWQISDTDSTLGDWLIYTAGDVSPPLAAPPQGQFAAITDQDNTSREILYQDVTIPSNLDQAQLSLLAYYSADAAISAPNSLDPLDDPNEQYRIDVMRPSAPLDSVAPGDILSTVFRTANGDPAVLAPTLKTADLSALIGQTVRLRFAVVVTEDVLSGSTDAVAINGLTVGKAKLNQNAGTAKLPVTVTDPGTVTLSGKGVKPRSASSSASVGAGSTVKLLVKPKGKTRSKLNDSGKAKVKVTVNYTPSGSAAFSDQEKLKLKKR